MSEGTKVLMRRVGLEGLARSMLLPPESKFPHQTLEDAVVNLVALLSATTNRCAVFAYPEPDRSDALCKKVRSPHVPADAHGRAYCR